MALVPHHHVHTFEKSKFSLSILYTVLRFVYSHTLYDLAHVCAEVCCNVGVLVNKELMGAFRALCLPMTMMKSCMTGFNHLTSKSNVSKHHIFSSLFFRRQTKMSLYINMLY